MTLAPGLHQLDPASYHADPCERPSLSASTAKTLLTTSPLHAWTNNPRLNPDYQRKTEDKFELGTVVHSLVLQGIDVAEILAFPDYRSGPAKEARDLARAHGRIPILAKQAHDVEQMVTAIWKQLAGTPLFRDGQPEVTVVWDEDDVLCRARLDWLTNDHALALDLKTTSQSAQGAKWSKRALYDHGCDIQCAAYRRAVRAATGVDPKWKWVVVETSPPYALQIIEPGSDVLAYGDARFDKALAIWRQCLETDEWPGYGTEPYIASVPGFVESAWLEYEAREKLAA